jgi:hypothetical protein
MADMELNGRNNNGQFKSGHNGFKPRGSVNEFQKVTREKLGEFLKLKLPELPTIYDSLSAREKAKLILAIAEFFLPKQKEILIDAELQQQVEIDYTKLSQSTLKEILEHTNLPEHEPEN